MKFDLEFENEMAINPDVSFSSLMLIHEILEQVVKQIAFKIWYSFVGESNYSVSFPPSPSQ